MRNRGLGIIVLLFMSFASPPFIFAQNSSASPVTGKQSYDPHDLNGTWRGENRFGNGRWDNTIPEPPLTDWAKQHLLYKEGISHDSLSGTLADPSKPARPVPNAERQFYATDSYGVPANAIDGEYPGKDCEPLAAPATFDYPGIMEIYTTPGGDRIFQLIAYHREWRTWWLNRDHPKVLDPTYEGDSTAHWDGNTLVVDTVGFNGRSMISGAVGHRKSDAFHLVERYQRVDHDHLEIHMTYYDPKAWGDKSWPGFIRYYKLAAKEDFAEFICSPREYKEYDSNVTTRIESSTNK